jgi:CheY-like chemotaxis protein
MHGGTIEAESSGLGNGSTFTLRFPMQEAPPDEVSEVSETKAFKPGSVLLIEDNDDARELFAMMLESSGYTVLQADNGVMGVRIAAEEVPEIAFIDIGLPGINGYQVAEQIRSNPITKSISLVALSGYGTASDIQQSANAGFDRHLVKPVKLADLVATIVAFRDQGVPTKR